MSYISCEELLDLRRNAYVECTHALLEKDNVVGIFGDEVFASNDFPLAVFYACGLYPVPIEGVDAEIFHFGHEGGVCDVIKSTLIYLKTDKCPLLHSSKMYVITDKCNLFYQKLKTATDKKVFKLKTSSEMQNKNTEKELIKTLCEVYNCKYEEELYKKAKTTLLEIEKIITKLECFSQLSPKLLFLLRYYTPYIIDLNQRLEFFQNLSEKTTFNSKKKTPQIIKAFCPRGNFSGIFQKLQTLEKNAKTNPLLLRRGFSNCSFGYTNCPLSHKIHTVKYKLIED